MERDNINVVYLPIGFTVLNLNTLVRTVWYEWTRNNDRNGGYTIVL